MKEQYFNQNYAHLTLTDLKEELIRLQELELAEEPIFNQEEIDNVEIEIEMREGTEK